MKILVYGAGAIGGYFGAKLARSGHDVTLLVREITAQAINAYGLQVTEGNHETTTRIKTVTSIPQAFAQDTQYNLIILGMKSYDIAEALNPLIAFCPKQEMIITTQNGIGIEKLVYEHYGTDSVIAGSVTLPISKETNNQLIVEKDGGIAFAPTNPRQNIKPWVSLFKKADVKTARFKNYESMKWSKALLNIMGNASSAILNRTPGIVYRSDTMFELELRMLEEAIAVMEAKKLQIVDLPNYSPKNLARALRMVPRGLLKPLLSKMVATGRGEKMPSFHIDLSSNKSKNEVQFHNAAIAKAGKAHNIPTPVNAAYASVLLKIMRDELDWQEFNGRPKRLLAEVRKFE